MMLQPSKQKSLQERMARLEISEKDLLEKFILGSGKGGQKINKTSSCVYLKHLPTGIEIKCQANRSRELNRYLARQELCERLEERLFQKKSQKQKEREKIRRQKQRRTRKQQAKVLQAKRLHSEKKHLRTPPPDRD